MAQEKKTTDPLKYTIEITPAARKSTKNIPHDILARISKAIDALAINPLPNGVKALKGELTGYHRIRVGDYRIVYTLQNDKLVILIVRIAY